MDFCIILQFHSVPRGLQTDFDFDQLYRVGGTFLLLSPILLPTVWERLEEKCLAV